MPTCRLLRHLWSFLEYPNSSKSAKVFALLSMVVIMLSLVLFVVVTLPEFSDLPEFSEFSELSQSHTATKNGTRSKRNSAHANKHDAWVFIVDTCIIVFFSAEFLLRLVSCPNKFRFCIGPANVVDFLSLLPYYLPFALEGSSHGAGQHEGIVSLLRVFR